MASSFIATRPTSLLFLLLVIQFSHLSISLATPFCPHTLSRPTCPDLPTYDAFDITTYGGKWFEIGSSANFKNLQESGGICVVANYSLVQAPSPGVGAVIGVTNTLYSLGNGARNQSQLVISLTSGEICSRAFNICSQIDGKGAGSPLTEGLVLLSTVSGFIKDECPDLSASLDSARTHIEGSIDAINEGLDSLSSSVQTIQILNAQIGQDLGNATIDVANLTATAEKANASISAIAEAVEGIDEHSKNFEKDAKRVQAEGDSASASNLKNAAVMISQGTDAITEQVAQIQKSLETVVGISSLFLTPSFGPKGFTGRIVGTAVQNATSPGKLEVTFPSFPPGRYWVLAVDGTESDGGYSASLVYGCEESQFGGAEETLFVLSRTPALPYDVVDKLLAKAATLGVLGDCSTPFIYTEQTPSCGNPPQSTDSY